jgi:hypothetical protein
VAFLGLLALVAFCVMRGALGVGGVTLLFQFNQEVLEVECDLELFKIPSDPEYQNPGWRWPVKKQLPTGIFL